MNSPSSTPITASGSQRTYTLAVKKHFSHRPTAFALSPHFSSTSPSSSFASSSFASSSFASSSCSSKPTPRTSDIDEDTQNALANLGWKIRSSVNQGYSRSQSIAFSIGGRGEVEGEFRSERDVLREVVNGRREWSRVATAPSIGATFEDLRSWVAGGDVCMVDEIAFSVVGGKRGRRDSTSDTQETQSHMPECDKMGQRRQIRGLPQLSFSSTTSCHSSVSNLSAELGIRADFPTSQSSVSPFPTNSDSNRIMAKGVVDEDIHFYSQPAERKIDDTSGQNGFHFNAQHFSSTNF
ncbi:hypothetical protein NDA12_006434 [Ustilago hordei]|nr:hypothetical protein NDA15_001600 [Ustilago hordei]KAJ1594107.1 hypothetical protein NDA12_006434 [Ustilago hordei]